MKRDELLYRAGKRLNNGGCGFHPVWLIRFLVSQLLACFKPTKRRLIKSEELKDRAEERYKKFREATV